MVHFCTYFDSHYLAKGLALYHSMREHCAPFQLWVLCMDDLTYRVLGKIQLPNMSLIPLMELEGGDKELLHTKETRSRIEYYFTCTPCLPLYLLERFSRIPAITYVDADLFFYHEPKALFRDMEGFSVAMTEHRYAPNLKKRNSYGLYNVGWLSFRRDQTALSCLRWWREKCLEWCFDRVENGRYADQKYLERWPLLFPGILVLKQKGANLAPWNISNYALSWDGGMVFVDEEPLIFFHFHGFRKIASWLYDSNFSACRARMTSTIRQHIIVPYIRALSLASERYLPPRSRMMLDEGIRNENQNRAWNERIWQAGNRVFCVILSLLNRNYVTVNPRNFLS